MIAKDLSFLNEGSKDSVGGCQLAKANPSLRWVQTPNCWFPMTWLTYIYMYIYVCVLLEK